MKTISIKYIHKSMRISLYFLMFFLCIFPSVKNLNSESEYDVCRKDKDVYKGPWGYHPNFQKITHYLEIKKNEVIYEGTKLASLKKNLNNQNTVEVCKTECLSDEEYQKVFPLDKINRLLMIWFSNNQYSYEFMGKEKQIITISCGAPDQEYSVSWILYNNGRRIIREEVLNGKDVYIRTNDFKIDKNKPWILNQDSIPTEFRKNNFINNLFY